MKYFLGTLEQAIMEVVWRQGTVSVRDVVEALRPGRRLAYTTVMTVMTRLADDGILRRTKTAANSYRYTALECRDTFAAHRSRINIDALVARYGDAALVQFLSRIERIPPEKLQRLKRLSSRSRHG